MASTAMINYFSQFFRLADPSSVGVSWLIHVATVSQWVSCGLGSAGITKTPGSHPPAGQPRLLHMVVSGVCYKSNKLFCTSAFQASACIIVTDISLAKASSSPMATLQIQEVEKQSIPLDWRTWKDCWLKNFFQLFTKSMYIYGGERMGHIGSQVKKVGYELMVITSWKYSNNLVLSQLL